MKVGDLAKSQRGDVVLIVSAREGMEDAFVIVALTNGIRQTMHKDYLEVVSESR